MRKPLRPVNIRTFISELRQLADVLDRIDIKSLTDNELIPLQTAEYHTQYATHTLVKRKTDDE